ADRTGAAISIPLVDGLEGTLAEQRGAPDIEEVLTQACHEAPPSPLPPKGPLQRPIQERQGLRQLDPQPGPPAPGPAAVATAATAIAAGTPLQQLPLANQRNLRAFATGFLDRRSWGIPLLLVDPDHRHSWVLRRLSRPEDRSATRQSALQRQACSHDPRTWRSPLMAGHLAEIGSASGRERE